MANIKSMSLQQAKAYKQQLKDSGKSLSTSKEMGKVEDYIKTLSPEKYGAETVQSAYTKLSSGVTERGGWTEANLPELNARGIRTMLDPIATGGGAGGGAAGGGEGDLGGYLGEYQDGVYGAAGSPELRDSITQQLTGGAEAPAPLDRAGEFEKMRAEMGVADLETTLNSLKAQLEEQYAQKRARTQDAEGKPVAMGVIAGRVGEIERQEMDRIDAIGRQMNVIADQLNTSYGVIETYMNFMNMDYQDAVNAYNTDFNRNLQIYNLVEAELDEQTATARANLQMYQNSILSGNMSYDNLSSQQKAFVGKLEIQAGLPMGFTANLKPEEKVLYQGTRESGGVKYIDIITQGADGKPTTQTIEVGATGSGGGGGSSGGGGSKESVATYARLMEEAINTAMKEAADMGISYEAGGNYITENQARPLIQSWRNTTGRSEDDWWTKFGKHVYRQ